MGWTGVHRSPGQTTREFFEHKLLTPDQRFLATAVVGGVFYAAVQDEKEVWGLVVLMQRSHDYFNFTFKTISDTMGPTEAKCPARILDLLSPTDSEYANEWRQRCRDYAAKPKPKPGALVTFSRPIKFQNDTELDTFVYEKGNSFRDPRWKSYIYHIPGWQDLPYTVVQP